MLQVENARLDDLLNLLGLALICVTASIVCILTTCCSGISIRCDQLHLIMVILDNFLSRGCLRQLLIRLEHLLEEEEEGEDLVLACARDHYLCLILEDGLLNFVLQTVLADELVELAG